jgi:hypothetical protein
LNVEEFMTLLNHSIYDVEYTRIEKRVVEFKWWDQTFRREFIRGRDGNCKALVGAKFELNAQAKLLELLVEECRSYEHMRREYWALEKQLEAVKAKDTKAA